jgi:hypothetical protein
MEKQRYVVIPQSGKTVILIVHHGISITHLEHNLLSTIQMRLHDVVVHKSQKCQGLEPTNLSHNISVRGDNVDDVLIIPMDLHAVVSCFPTFKLTQEKIDTCDRYEMTYESPEYDPSVKSFSKKEAGMKDSQGRLKIQGIHIPDGAKCALSTQRSSKSRS